MKKISKTEFRCDKCGKIMEYNPNWNDDDDMDEMVIANQAWSIDLGRAGYGSKLDTCSVRFDLCDDCLYEFINSFQFKDIVYGTGC